MTLIGLLQLLGFLFCLIFAFAFAFAFEGGSTLALWRPLAKCFRAFTRSKDPRICPPLQAGPNSIWWRE